MSSSPSCLTRFLTDPWSSAKVVVPSIAIEVVLHKKVWEKASLRHLTLYLTLANAYWFATSLNFNLFETPLLCQVPSLDERQKVDVGRHRYGWLNKVELVVGVVTLDLFCEWRKRIIDRNGFVDLCLSSAVLAPALITVAQGAYFLPKLLDRCWNDKPATTVTGVDNSSCCSEKTCCRAYIGIEAAKVVGLAVAGLRFGKMLTV
ncbi:hypothetical protein BDB00DRAFT_957765 [Zychaea mexicana]|uniref:uncharacterized protein n=1 Tax=Zychaea mexicana TaxID=64656 RepID=UPI0022FDFDE9|nr:uncharacterized protein BDB00DRAFT_957765 [Zychaea mexicana]KAI9492936.1 hypothetical protein BDB00DRAFT_957765 [Zychaea mexicana]